MTKTELANMAISHLGTGMTIANLETEDSEEAAACRVFFDTSLEATLREFDWPFARVFKELTLVEEKPNQEWAFAYRYPNDCQMLRAILKTYRMSPLRVPYSISKDNAGRLVLTDHPDPVAHYTQRITNLALCTADFAMAFSYKLAMYVAPRLTQGDPFKLKQEMQMAYIAEISAAKAMAANEERQDAPFESEFIRVRY